jgi:hypothetical protein
MLLSELVSGTVPSAIAQPGNEVFAAGHLRCHCAGGLGSWLLQISVSKKVVLDLERVRVHVKGEVRQTAIERSVPRLTRP